MKRRPDIAIWGAGMAGSVHGEACQALGWPVVAVASRSPERAQKLSATLRSELLTYDRMASERVADVAIVTTPPSCHAADVQRLLDIGYHVVVESPISCSLADADQIIESEHRAGRPMLYSEHLTSAPAIKALLARATGIGKVTHLSARAIQRPPTWRTSTEMEWGGGVLFDLGVHSIALVLRVADVSGLGPAKSVTASMVTDGASVQILFESGTDARLTVKWLPDIKPDWDLQVSSTQAVLRVDLYPTPTLEFNGDPVRLETDSASTTSLVNDYGYVAQLRRFWGDIRIGRPVPTTTDFARSVLDIVCAAHWSAGSGGTTVPLPFDGNRTLSPIDLWRSARRTMPE